MARARFGIELIFTRNGAALATAVMSFPLMVRAIRISLENIDRGLEDAARTLGAGPLDRFAAITLPLMLPGLLAGAITAFSAALGEFGAVITFVSNIPGETRTLPLALYSALQEPGGEAAAARLAILSVVLGLGGLAGLRMVRTPRAAHAGTVMLQVAASKRLGAFALEVAFELPTPASSRCSDRPAAARAPRSTSSPVCSRRTRARWCSTTRAARYRRGIDVAAERRRIGYVFQDARLFPHLNVAANLSMRCSAPRAGITWTSMRWRRCSISTL